MNRGLYAPKVEEIAKALSELDDVELVEAFAALVTQAGDRIAAREPLRLKDFEPIRRVMTDQAISLIVILDETGIKVSR